MFKKLRLKASGHLFMFFFSSLNSKSVKRQTRAAVSPMCQILNSRSGTLCSAHCSTSWRGTANPMVCMVDLDPGHDPNRHIYPRCMYMMYHLELEVVHTRRCTHPRALQPNSCTKYIQNQEAAHTCLHRIGKCNH